MTLGQVLLGKISLSKKNLAFIHRVQQIALILRRQKNISA
jgi:hypothetical protein